MKKIDNNQLDSKQNTFDPKGSLVVPKNANITLTQPAVLMTAKAGTYLYALPPSQAKKDCQIELSESKDSVIPYYYFPNLVEGIEKWTSSLNYGIILFLEDNKPYARVCFKNVLSEYKIELKLSEKQKADFPKLTSGKIDSETNPELFNAIRDQVLEKTKHHNSSNFKELGHISYKATHIDLNGKIVVTDKNIEINYAFKEDSEVVARPLPSSNSMQPAVYEARMFVRIPEKETSRFRPENSDHIETISQGYIYAEDLKSTAHKFKPSTEVLFKTRPHLSQTRQRSLPNCFLLATISSILNSDQGSDFIMNMMKQDDEGVTVRLYEKDRNDQFIPVYIRIPNAILYGNDNLGIFSSMVKASWHDGGLWIHALETAYATLGLKVNSNKKEKFCPSILGSYGEGGFSDVAMAALTGAKAGRFSISEFEYPKFNTFDFFICAGSLNGITESTHRTEEILREFLPQDSLLRHLFDNNEADLILLLTALSQKMLTDPMAFINITEPLNNFDDAKITNQTEFEAALRQSTEQLAKVFQQLDPAVSQRFLSHLNLEKPRKYGPYSFYLISGEEFSGKYTLQQIKIFDKLDKESKQQAILTAGTYSKGVVSGLASNHAYTITRCFSEDKLLYINARNPWNFSSLSYSKTFGKMRRTRSTLHDISKIELGDFFKNFNAYEVGHKPMVPPLGLKNTLTSDLTHQVKIEPLQILYSYTEAAFNKYGLIETTPGPADKSDELSKEQQYLIQQELSSHFSSFQNFIEQRIKILDSYYPFKKFVAEAELLESKIAIPEEEDKEHFSNEIHKLIDPDLDKPISANVVGQYLNHFDKSDMPASIKKYSDNIIKVISHIRNFQKAYSSLKAASSLIEARFCSEQYLHHFAEIISGLAKIQHISSSISDCKVSSSSFFYSSATSLRNVQQMEIMSKQLFILSPYVEFVQGSNLGEFFRKFTNTPIEEVKVVAKEMQRILLLVDSSIKVSIDETKDHPVLTLTGVNQKDLAALQAAKLNFRTDKIAHPIEYAIKTSQTLSS